MVYKMTLRSFIFEEKELGVEGERIGALLKTEIALK